MPIMDGYEATRRFVPSNRRDIAHMPIIAMDQPTLFPKT